MTHLVYIETAGFLLSPPATEDSLRHLFCIPAQSYLLGKEKTTQCLSLKKTRKRKKNYLLECNLPFVVTCMEVKAVKTTEAGLSLQDGIAVLLGSVRYLSVFLTSSKVVCLLVNAHCSLFWVCFVFCFAARCAFGCGGLSRTDLL